MAREANRTLAISFLIVVIVFGLTLALVVWIPGGSRTQLPFDGVTLTITYVGSSPEIFGPVHQNACLQRPYATPGGLLGPDCPTNLTGGKEYNFTIFELFVPFNFSGHNVYDAFLNMTLYSPVPFFQSTCASERSPPPATHNSTLSQVIPSGTACAWEVTLAVPNPAPVTDGGFWLAATLTAHVV